MPITIDEPRIENWLQQEASKRGLTADEYARSLLELHQPLTSHQLGESHQAAQSPPAVQEPMQDEEDEESSAEGMSE